MKSHAQLDSVYLASLRQRNHTEQRERDLVYQLSLAHAALREIREKYTICNKQTALLERISELEQHLQDKDTENSSLKQENKRLKTDLQQARENSKVQECADLTKSNTHLTHQLKDEQARSANLKQKLQSVRDDVEKEHADKYKAVVRVLKQEKELLQKK